MKSKYISFFLAFLMLIVLLAGCGQSEHSHSASAKDPENIVMGDKPSSAEEKDKAPSDETSKSEPQDNNEKAQDTDDLPDINKYWKADGSFELENYLRACGAGDIIRHKISKDSGCVAVTGVINGWAVTVYTDHSVPALPTIILGDGMKAPQGKFCVITENTHSGANMPPADILINTGDEKTWSELIEALPEVIAVIKETPFDPNMSKPSIGDYTIGLV